MVSDKSLAGHTLEELLPHSLMSVPIISAQATDKIWIVTAMLCHHLETFTDNIVIMEGDKPLGILGSRETLALIKKNPTPEIFEEYMAKDVMCEFVNIVSPKTTLEDLILLIERQRIGFAIIPYKNGGYAAVSVRALLEIAALSNLDLRTSEIPKKSLVTFNPDDTINKVLTTMFHRQIRRLISEDHSLFISDRGIIEKIVTDLNYLDGISNFLEMKASSFPLYPVRKISNDITIPKLAKIMLGIDIPYVLFHDQVISPWDIAMLLGEKF